MNEETEKTFVDYLILKTVIDSEEDLIECMKKVFDFANDMGIQGKKVFGLHIDHPSYKDPLSIQTYFKCKISCSEKERTAWRMACEKKIMDMIDCEFHDEES